MVTVSMTVVVDIGSYSLKVGDSTADEVVTFGVGL